MRISFTSKGDFNATRDWLNKVSNSNPDNVLKTIAKEGEVSLASNTPRDTGETASGWKSKIERNSKGAEVVWYNDAHPELDVNLAKLIDLGHGTGTGGYVPPKPYIKKSMDGVFGSAGDKIAGELIK
mgnify:CR=1 FL=1